MDEASPRVLHLIDGDGKGQRAYTLGLMAETLRAARGEHRVVLIGPSGLADDARAAGLGDAVPEGAVAWLPPHGRGLATSLQVALRLRRAWADRWRPARVCAWSEAAAHIGRVRSCGRRLSVVVTRRFDLSPPRVRLMRRLGPVWYIATSSAAGEALVEHGVHRESVEWPSPTLTATPTAAARPGVDRVSDGTTERRIALLSDPPAAADAVHALMACAMARESGAAVSGNEQPLALIIHPDQRRRHAAIRMASQAKRRLRVEVDGRVGRPAELWPTIDAALHPGDDPDALPLRAAMAAGVPVVTPAPVPAEAGCPVVRVVNDSARYIGHGVHRLITDPALAPAVSAAARRRAAHSPVASLAGAVGA